MSKPKKSKPARFQITEVQRTFILIALIIFAVAFIYWIQTGIDDNFVETL